MWKKISETLIEGIIKKKQPNDLDRNVEKKTEIWLCLVNSTRNGDHVKVGPLSPHWRYYETPIIRKINELSIQLMITFYPTPSGVNRDKWVKRANNRQMMEKAKFPKQYVRFQTSSEKVCSSVDYFGNTLRSLSLLACEGNRESSQVNVSSDLQNNSMFWYFFQS